MKICQSCNYRFDNTDWLCPRCKVAPQSESDFLMFAPECNLVDDGFKSELFEELYDLEKKNFWFVSRNQLIVWALRNYFPGKESFLEIGCGTGFVLAEAESKVPSMSFSGSEIHIDGLAFARKRLERSDLWQMDARNIPFEEEFDVIGAFDVLEHIKEDKAVLSQMFKALRPRGGVVITVPQHPFLWSSVDEHACHERRYTATELKTKVREAGFDIIRTTSFVSLLLPLMIASRLEFRSSDDEFDPLEGLKINRALNWIFGRILRIETILIRSGISLPVGGSLLLVAQKPDNS